MVFDAPTIKPNILEASLLNWHVPTLFRQSEGVALTDFERVGRATEGGTGNGSCINGHVQTSR